MFIMKFTEDNTCRLVVMKRSKILYNGLFVKNEGRLSETGMGTTLVSSGAIPNFRQDIKS